MRSGGERGRTCSSRCCIRSGFRRGYSCRRAHTGRAARIGHGDEKLLALELTRHARQGCNHRPWRSTSEEHLIRNASRTRRLSLSWPELGRQRDGDRARWASGTLVQPHVVVRRFRRGFEIECSIGSGHFPSAIEEHANSASYQKYVAFPNYVPAVLHNSEEDAMRLYHIERTFEQRSLPSA